jgi:hypothetical protein
LIKEFPLLKESLIELKGKHETPSRRARPKKTSSDAMTNPKVPRVTGNR